MLSTMRPSPAHLISSRPSSPSPSQSPSRSRISNNKHQQSNNRSINKSTSNKKSSSSQQRKQRQPISDMEPSVTTTTTTSATPPSSSKKQSTPGLIALSKPISQQKDQVEQETPDSPTVDKASAGKKKSKKSAKAATTGAATTMEHRSSSPSPTGSKGPSQPLPVKNPSKSSKRSKNKSQLRKETQSDDISQLSKSAPTATTSNSNSKRDSRKSQINPNHLLDSASGWEMPATPPSKGNGSANALQSSSSFRIESARDSGLTWQQQLLGNSPLGHGSSHSVDIDRNRGRGIPKNGSTGNLSGKKKARDEEGSHDSSLTWQQALLASSKPRTTTGLAYDTFADARDAATFGTGDQPYGGNGRARSGSLGTKNDSSHTSIYIDDVFNNRSSPNVSRISSSTSMHPSTPIKGNSKSTPNKKGNMKAYAGPNFHNSPSPASLPAPKFSRNSRNFGNSQSQHPLADESTGSSNSDQSASDSEKEDMDRSKRSVTAPAEVQSTRGEEASTSEINRSTTIETLLARMMGTSA